MKKTLKKLQVMLTLSSLFDFLCVCAWAACVYLLPDFNYYDIIAIVFMVLTIVYYTVLVSSYVMKIGGFKNTTDLSIAKILADDALECYMFGEIGTLIFDKDRKIIWENDYLQKIGIKFIEHSLSEISPQLDDMVDHYGDDSPVNIRYDNKIFSVKLIKETNMFIFKNITESENEKKIFSDEALVAGFLQIDNYIDLASSMDENSFAMKISDLQRILIDYANSHRFYISALKNDMFFLLGNKKDFDLMANDNFRIVDIVREEFDGFTISIGFSNGYPGIPVLVQEARESLDVALSRGGDQVVISPYNENLIYIGGKSESKQSFSRTKIRILSQSFATTIKSAGNVLISGHYMADFDAIGSCLGVLKICEALNVPAKILYDSSNVENNCKHAFAKTFSPSQIADITVGYNEAAALIGPKTLLVAVDVNSPDRLIFPNFIYDDENINVAIVDHHRPGTLSFKNIVFNGIDSSASSACELIAEYIATSKYKIKLTPDEATFMLAGTTLDTDHFRNKVSSATFDAMIVLKGYGANSLKADEFLKEDYEQYALKIKFMNNIETPYTGIIIAQDPDQDEMVDRSILAIVSQESMSIAGIDAAFTVGRISETEVGISARSNASFNVELIMRKMGGGGHFAAAATTVLTTSTSEVVEKLKGVLDDYASMARTKSKTDYKSQTVTDLKVK